MLKQAMRDGLIYAVAAVLYRGLLILQVPLFARVLAPEDFGAIDLVEAVVTLINLTVALEVSQAIGVFFTTDNDSSNKREMASTAFWFTLAAYLFCIGIVLIFSDSFGQLIFGPNPDRMLTLAMLGYSFANGLFLLTHNLLRWMLKPWRFLSVAVVHGGVSLISSLLLVYHFEYGSLGVIIGQIIAGIVASGLAIVMSREFYGICFNRRLLGQMLAFSGPLVLSSAAVFASIFVDRFCLQRLLGLGAVGQYGVGYRIASVVGILVVGFSRAFTPLIYAKHKESDAPLHVSQCLLVFSALGVAIVAALTVFSPIIIELLAGPSYITSAQLVPLLAVSIIFGGMYIFAPGLSLEKRSKEIALISIFGAVLNLGLNLIFIPIMGLFGAAWATVISSACTAVAWLARGQRWYQIPFAKKELSIIFVVLVFTWIFASQMASLGWIARVVFFLTSLVFIYLPLRSLFDSMSKSMAKKID